MKTKEKERLLKYINFKKLPNLHQAVYDNNIRRVSKLIKLGNNVDKSHKAGKGYIYPPLLYARSITMVKLLLEGRANIIYKSINLIEANTLLWGADFKDGCESSEESIIAEFKLTQLIELASDRRYMNELTADSIYSIYNYLYKEGLYDYWSADIHIKAFKLFHSSHIDTRIVVEDMLYRCDEPGYAKIVECLLSSGMDKQEVFSMVNYKLKDHFTACNWLVDASEYKHVYLLFSELFSIGFKVSEEIANKINIQLKFSITEEELEDVKKLFDLFYCYNIVLDEDMLKRLVEAGMSQNILDIEISIEDQEKYQRIAYQLVFSGYSYPSYILLDTKNIDKSTLFGKIKQILLDYEEGKKIHREKFVYCYEYFKCNPQLSDKPWKKMEKLYSEYETYSAQQ